MALPQPDGFLATPATGKGPGVLVLHAWWGLNDTIKSLCSRLAEEGFTAFAPDLYHGAVADTIPGAEQLAGTLNANFPQASVEVADAARFLAEQTGNPQTPLAVIGFSLGAFYAVDLSAAEPDLIRSVVLFYGAGAGDLSASKASYLGHFAENDPYEPQIYIDELENGLKAAGRPVTFHVYEGTGHWFFEPDRTDAFHPEAAALAYERTVAFLKTNDATP